MSANWKIPRGTRAALNTLAAANGLVPFQPYWLTDESRVVVATAANAYGEVPTPGEVSAKLAASSYIKGLHGFCSGKPSGDEVIGGHIAPYDITLVSANSWAKCVTASTGTVTLIIKNGATQIGSITFTAGNAVGTVTITSGAVLQGDLITVVAPTTPDATLAGVAYLLKP